ncbi:unnamed protein product [Heterobilharzia americana]|nr:unnamed protein product [Heterobilharzia americana]
MSYYDSDLPGYYDSNGNFRPWMNSSYSYLSRNPERISNDLNYGKRIYIYRDYPSTSSYYSSGLGSSYYPSSRLRRTQSYIGLFDNSSLYGYSYPSSPYRRQTVDIFDDGMYSRY